jgi:hypothetical protein
MLTRAMGSRLEPTDPRFLQSLGLPLTGILQALTMLFANTNAKITRKGGDNLMTLTMMPITLDQAIVIRVVVGTLAHLVRQDGELRPSHMSKCLALARGGAVEACSPHRLEIHRPSAGGFARHRRPCECGTRPAHGVLGSPEDFQRHRAGGTRIGTVEGSDFLLGQTQVERRAVLVDMMGSAGFNNGDKASMRLDTPGLAS